MITSITKIKLKNILKLPKFFFISSKIFKQARSAQGNKGMRSRSTGLTFYTLTLWDDEKSMMDFMLSGPHKEAMKIIRNFSSDYGSSRWNSTDMPSWDDALSKLASDKR